jgi:hypothetical protein
MNKRRRFKAKRRRLEVKLTMAILKVNRPNAVAFLQGRYRPRRPRVDVHRVNRRMEMMFPRSGVFGDSLVGGPRTGYYRG